MFACHLHLRNLRVSVCPVALNLTRRHPSRFNVSEIGKNKSTRATRSKPSYEEQPKDDGLKFRSIQLPDFNPYAVIASELIAKDARQPVQGDADVAVLQRVREYIEALKTQLEPVRHVCTSSFVCLLQ